MYRSTMGLALAKGIKVCLSLYFVLLSGSYTYAQLAKVAELDKVKGGSSKPLTVDKHLIWAIETNDLKKVKSLIGNCRNINDQDFFGYTPLHYAAKRGALSIVSLLIEAKALLDQKSTRHGNTPLFLAIEAGHVKIAACLIDAGADITITNAMGYNALHLAIQHKRVDLVNLLLQAGACANSCTEEKCSPLILAIKVGSRAIVQQFLKQKNIDDIPDKEGYTALHWAIKQDAIAIFCLLMKFGKCNINAATLNGVTPLHLVAHTGNIIALKALLRCPWLEVNAQDITGSTPLHYAAGLNQIAVVKALIHHTSTDVNRQNHVGQTALHYAVQSDHIAIVKQLLKRAGKGVLLSNARGLMPLELAIFHKRLIVYKILLAYMDALGSDEYTEDAQTIYSLLDA